MEVAKLTYEALQVQYLTQLIHNSVTIFNVTMQGGQLLRAPHNFFKVAIMRAEQFSDSRTFFAGKLQ